MADKVEEGKSEGVKFIVNEFGIAVMFKGLMAMLQEIREEIDELKSKQ